MKCSAVVVLAGMLAAGVPMALGESERPTEVGAAAGRWRHLVNEQLGATKALAVDPLRSLAGRLEYENVSVLAWELQPAGAAEEVPAWSSALLEERSDFVYLRLERAPAEAAVHWLWVRPNLLVVWAEHSPAAGQMFRLRSQTSSTVQWNEPWQHWIGRGHALNWEFRLMPPRTWDWTAATSPTGSEATSDPTWTGRIREDSSLDGWLLVLLLQNNDGRPAAAFKHLASATAVGARIHRDGLPTLIAFRRATTSGPANLAGLAFEGPVAVNVFRPRR